MKKTIITFCNLLFSTFLISQTLEADYQKYGSLIRLQLKNSLFPDSLRQNGHKYDGKTYFFAENYNDSTVLVFIPNYFKAGKKTNIVVHFHGWYNNVDSVVRYFQLIEQFYDAKKNAILVIPQGPKNAPDSYGGKLEKQGVFNLFVEETLNELKKRKITPSVFSDKIVISGHSGAYRVMAHILLQGGLPIQEVFLFDGLYGQLEKFGHWITQSKGRFINIYTKDGGTFNATQDFMIDLKGWNIPFLATNEEDLTEERLKNNRIMMIYTLLTHNEVIHKKRQFYQYLKTSCHLK